MGAKRNKKHVSKTPRERKPLPWRRIGQGLLLMVGITMTAVIGTLAYQHLSSKLDMPIAEVVVDGDFRYLDREAVRQAIGPVASLGFLSVDVREVHRRILDLPWVATASVRRVWPGTLIIRVEEHRPYLRWGDSQLLSVTGALYRPVAVDGFEDLVRLDGDDAYHADVFRHYLGLSRQFEKFGAIRQLGRSSRGSWSLVLDSGLSIELGSSELESRLERTLRFMEYFSEQLVAVQRIDARYPNGVAIALRKQEESVTRSGDATS